MKERIVLNKIIYLYPEVEGKQNYVCWGFSKDAVTNKFSKDLKAKVKEALSVVATHNNPWIKNRSFSVGLGEDNKTYWVSLPRELTAKALKIFAAKLESLNIPSKLVVTSHQNPFGNKLPFQPVISYDRGFIVDSSRIEAKLATQKISNI